VRLNVEDDPATAPKPKYEKIQKRVVEIWKGNELEASLDVTDQFYADGESILSIAAVLRRTYYRFPHVSSLCNHPRLESSQEPHWQGTGSQRWQKHYWSSDEP